MPRNDTQEPLQPFPPPFNNFVREPVREYFARERRDVDSCGFALEYVAEGFEVRVSPSDEGVTEFKGGNVSLEDMHKVLRIRCDVGWSDDAGLLSAELRTLQTIS
jgi:hypothetical protein